jgi:hypothetical protein
MAAPPMSRPRAPGPSLRLSIPLLALGVVAAIVAGVGLANGLVHTLDNATLVSGPGTVQVQCRAGSYLLYVESGTPSVSGAPSSVVVTAPDGATVPLQAQAATETVTRYGQRFSGQLGFNVVNPGSYTVALHTAGADLVVAPSFTTIARENLGWDILLLVGLLVGLTGLTLLVIRLVQRSRSRRRVAAFPGGPWGAPPGWSGHQGPPRGPGQPGWAPPGQPGWARRRLTARLAAAPRRPRWMVSPASLQLAAVTGRPAVTGGHRAQPSPSRAALSPERQPAPGQVPTSADDEPEDTTGGQPAGWPRPSSKPPARPAEG